jgi:hypothetical protein
MKKLNQITLFINMLMFCIITGNFILLLLIKSDLNSLIRRRDWMSLLVASLLMLATLCHLFSLSNLVLQFRKLKVESFLRAIAFALGVFSLFLVAVDVVMLTDIGKEYMLHNVTGEWNILFSNHGIHALFALVSIIQYVDDSKRISTMTSMPEALVDEATFCPSIRWVLFHPCVVFKASLP